ncbi:MAG: protein kinase, partial [Myxococcales bacterium]|nr:protein kinase [Myxococcales bacterium]
MSDVPADVADGFAAAGYRALGELGRGAFGVVYAAESEAGAPLAIKVLATRDPQVLQRFRAEARLLGRIEHDGVIRVLGTGALQDGQPYIVMERFGDASLDREVPLGCAVPMAKAVDLARQLLESLAAAHAVGVVHRDVKESNVLIERATG